MTITFLARLLRCAILVALGFATQALAAWDITDTGQPYDDVKITVNEGTWMSVDVSPDGKTLVFDMLGDLYLMPATGGEAKVLRQGPAYDRNPHFSPDGSRITFLSDGGGYDNAWVINVDGSGAREVSHETYSYVGTPAWTADGNYIMARRFSVEGRRTGAPFGNHLWLYHTAGGAGRKIVEAPGAVAEPTLSRDGHWLYYTEDSAPPAGKPNPDDANFVIKRRDLTTGATITLVTGYGGAMTPQISPDGASLAFVRRVATKDILFVYDLKSGKQRPVFDGLSRDLKGHNTLSGFYPTFGWFPDSRHVAIWAKGALFKIDMGTGEFRKIPFSATATHRITRAVRAAQNPPDKTFAARAIDSPTLAPDGKTLVWSAVGQLWKKLLPEGKPERLSSEHDFAYSPSFSPDGLQILYVKWEDAAGSTLQSISLDGKSIKTVLAFDARVAHAAYARDGSKIVFQVQRSNPFIGGYHQRSGIYWLAAAGGGVHFVSSEGSDPVFSAAGDRIYYNLANQGAEGLSILKSVTLEGTDPREHIRSPHAHHLRLSPDGRWVAFQENHGLYVAPYLESGVAMSLTTPSGAVPVTKLTQHRGLDQRWSADGTHVQWISGNDYYSAAIPSDAGDSPPSFVNLGLEVASDIPEGTIAFTGGRIITMRGDEVIENGVVVVERNHIVAVGPAGSVRIPQDAKTYDLSGKTVMPGLVDAHAHMVLSPQPDEFMVQQFSRYYANLAYGVTTTFDPAPHTNQIFGLAEMVRAGRMVGPRIFTTGWRLMGFLGDSLDDARVTSLESARDHVQRLKDAGAIAIKSYVQPGRVERQQLVKAARELGMMAMPEGEGQFDHDLTFILDGYTTVEHNLPNDTLYDDVVQLWASSKTAATPTLLVTQGELNGMQYFYQSSPHVWEMEKLRRFTPAANNYSAFRGGERAFRPLWAHQRTLAAPDQVYEIGTRSVARTLKRLNDAGVTVNMGSHGEIDGIGAIWELWLINQGGMSNHDTLRVGTINGARTLGMDKDLGSLEVGKLADLIVLDNDPLKDIKALDTVRYTMINGRLYDSLSMNEIGNYDRPRGKFYWEVDMHPTIDWNDSMIGQPTGGGGGDWQGDEDSVATE